MTQCKRTPAVGVPLTRLGETVPRQSLIVSDSAGLHESYTELFTRTGQTVFTIFCFRKMFKITKLVPKCFIMSVDRTRSSRMLLVLARILQDKTLFCAFEDNFKQNGVFWHQPLPAVRV